MRHITKSYIYIYIRIDICVCLCAVFKDDIPFSCLAMWGLFLQRVKFFFSQSHTNHQDWGSCSSAVTLPVINKSSEEQRVTGPL